MIFNRGRDGVAVVVAVVLFMQAVLTTASNYDQLIGELNSRNRQHHDRLFADPVTRLQLQQLYASANGPYQSMLERNARQQQSASSMFQMPETNDNVKTEVDSSEADINAGEGSMPSNVISDRDWETFKRELGKMRPVPSRRKPEEVDQPNHLQGELKIQAGNGKGNDAVHQLEAVQPEMAELTSSSPRLVKSDSKLPAYCNPPNPCPVGVNPDTAQSPCDRNVPDQKQYQRDYNAAQILSGQCKCDNEHMHDKCRAIFAEAAAANKATVGDNDDELNAKDSKENELNNLKNILSNENKVDAIPQSSEDNAAAQLDLLDTLERTRGHRLRRLLRENNDNDDNV